MPPQARIILGDTALTLADVRALASGRAKLELSAAGHSAIVKAREIVERLVDHGTAVYGVTTGVGSQKDFEVSRAAIARYNNLMITAHATLMPGENAAKTVVR